MKQYIGIVRDHSGSMRNLAKKAMDDYNSNVEVIKSAAEKTNIDTIVSVVKCGIGPGFGRVEREIVNSAISILKPINTYGANGGSTPLFDSVGDLIEQFKSVPDYDDPNVSFLILVITDGEENSSKKWKDTLSGEIKKLHASDRWTFAFRVPRGYSRSLAGMGIPEGNILEWDQTQQGFTVATQATTEAVEAFFQAREAGKSATRTFYSDLSHVKQADVQANLTEITPECLFFKVEDASKAIQGFVEEKFGKFWIGIAFYEMVKKEKAIQDHKLIVIRNKTTKKVYSGTSARKLLGLPMYGTVSLTPGKHGDFDIFIQSKSVNRKLPLNTEVLVWQKARAM